MRRFARNLLQMSCFFLASIGFQAAFADELYDREPINYLSATPHDPISELQKKIDAGEVKLEFNRKHGYLKSVLQHLKVPESTQGLVFSKTSFQRRFIGPSTPRAIYFSDDMYVGWVQNGKVLEFSAVDPQLGAVFYSLQQSEKEKPKFKRHTHACLQCHSSSMTKDVPGHLVRSIFPTTRGRANFGMGTFRVDDETPLKNRWGGWYVSGTHGKQRHMGNAFLTGEEDDLQFDRDEGANVTDLSSLFNLKRYLTEHSDLVALMVLEHQTQMHNMLAQSNYYGKLALHDEQIIRGMVEKEQAEAKKNEETVPEEYQRSRSIQLRIDNAGKRVVKMLLFSKAIKFEEPLVGTSGFTEEFSAMGPFDSKKRSLRELDLQTRLFKYPCSYLIYSAAFNELPEPVKESTYRQLWEVLTGKNQDESFAHLSAEDRQAILEILQETKSDLPSYWK